MSRVKKKLLLYFILIAIVSISVSAEIILEFSSAGFRNDVTLAHMNELKKHIPAKELAAADAKLDRKAVSLPITSLRNRMILLLIVVSGSIFGAFFLFARDIVSPMEGMVDATKKIAGGDLTVTVPVKSEDELGQIAGLINDMNINLQDMIMQIRGEITRHMNQIIKASYRLGEISNEQYISKILNSKRMKVSDFNYVLSLNKELIVLLDSISSELFALQKFVNMYKIYSSHSEVTQEELDNIMKDS
jgi:methyl-accepting chemotaxis protein